MSCVDLQPPTDCSHGDQRDHGDRAGLGDPDVPISGHTDGVCGDMAILSPVAISALSTPTDLGQGQWIVVNTNPSPVATFSSPMDPEGVTANPYLSPKTMANTSIHRDLYGVYEATDNPNPV